MKSENAGPFVPRKLELGACNRSQVVFRYSSLGVLLLESCTSRYLQQWHRYPFLSVSRWLFLVRYGFDGSRNGGGLAPAPWYGSRYESPPATVGWRAKNSSSQQ